MPAKMKRPSYGRGECRFCHIRKPLNAQGRVESHPIPGNARGASRCGGTGLLPVSAKA